VTRSTLSRALFRRKPAAKKGKKRLAATPNSCKQKGQKTVKSADSAGKDHTFSESHFFSRVNVEVTEAGLVRRLVHQPRLQLNGPEKRNRVATQNILPS